MLNFSAADYGLLITKILNTTHCQEKVNVYLTSLVYTLIKSNKKTNKSRFEELVNLLKMEFGRHINIYKYYKQLINVKIVNNNIWQCLMAFKCYMAGYLFSIRIFNENNNKYNDNYSYPLPTATEQGQILLRCLTKDLQIKVINQLHSNNNPSRRVEIILLELEKIDAVCKELRYICNDELSSKQNGMRRNKRCRYKMKCRYRLRCRFYHPEYEKYNFVNLDKENEVLMSLSDKYTESTSTLSQSQSEQTTYQVQLKQLKENKLEKEMSKYDKEEQQISQTSSQIQHENTSSMSNITSRTSSNNNDGRNDEMSNKDVDEFASNSKVDEIVNAVCLTNYKASYFINMISSKFLNNFNAYLLSSNVLKPSNYLVLLSSNKLYILTKISDDLTQQLSFQSNLFSTRAKDTQTNTITLQIINDEENLIEDIDCHEEPLNAKEISTNRRNENRLNCFQYKRNNDFKASFIKQKTVHININYYTYSLVLVFMLCMTSIYYYTAEKLLCNSYIKLSRLNDFDNTTNNIKNGVIMNTKCIITNQDICISIQYVSNSIGVLKHNMYQIVFALFPNLNAHLTLYDIINSYQTNELYLNFSNLSCMSIYYCIVNIKSKNILLSVKIKTIINNINDILCVICNCNRDNNINNSSLLSTEFNLELLTYLTSQDRIADEYKKIDDEYKNELNKIDDKSYDYLSEIYHH